MIKEILGSLGLAVGVIIASGLGALILLGALCSVKDFSVTERLVNKVDQIQERIMLIEGMVARGDNKCGG